MLKKIIGTACLIACVIVPYAFAFVLLQVDKMIQLPFVGKLIVGILYVGISMVVSSFFLCIFLCTREVGDKDEDRPPDSPYFFPGGGW